MSIEEREREIKNLAIKVHGIGPQLAGALYLEKDKDKRWKISHSKSIDMRSAGRLRTFIRWIYENRLDLLPDW